VWDFSTDPEFQEKLDWADEFMRTKVEPLQYVINHPLDLRDPVRQALVPPLPGLAR
jgi:acyl-CoA dehydrogenase